MQEEDIDFSGLPTYELNQAIKRAEEGIANFDHAFPDRQRERGKHVPFVNDLLEVPENSDDAKPDNEADVVDADFELVED